ncbi:hypothetical protein [Olleya namhaensis]|uniref:Uncharacterized protein n=1 Tax=Olleya namhaensis TaxID=1144750 RepID=A0A1I3JP41_9FLAO|nr:hypothetical protein [Olleya namhaensis]SFI62039.1 hypothetical protein SAMN05443431_101491 [Olleya namhaensis]
MRNKHYTYIVFVAFLLVACNKNIELSLKDINFSANDGKTQLLKYNGKITNEIESTFRLFLIINIKADTDIELSFTQNQNQNKTTKIRRRARHNEPVFFIKNTNKDIPQDITIRPFINKKEKIEEIEIIKILLKYNGETKEIQADEFLNYFETNKYLKYNNNTLKALNKNIKKFRPELKGTQQLKKMLQTFKPMNKTVAK